jgi:enamine deaminase RidA (YjgF/YER057c/UK114 family)
MAADESGVAPGAACDPRFPYYGAPATQQMSCIMRNVAAICEAAGTDVMNICRRRAFHVDLADSVYSIQEWARHFPGDKPASTTFRIGGPLLVPGCEVLLELVAWVP